MELTVLLAYGALPAIFLGAAAAISFAYNKLHARNTQSERDRDSYLSVLESSNDALFVINFVFDDAWWVTRESFAEHWFTALIVLASTLAVIAAGFVLARYLPAPAPATTSGGNEPRTTT